jgi:predicted adenine nucleotide alpha hydrolase (AANH) superfamily ATPase
MKFKKMKEKYDSSEIANSYVFRPSLSKKQKENADKELAMSREKNKTQISDMQKIYANLLQLRFLMEDYIKSESYDESLSFAYFLRHYIKLKYKVNKDFAKDIHLDETELSSILNNRRPPSDKTIIRLELHSNNTISAISWFKVLEKEKEHQFYTDKNIRIEEEKNVKNRFVFDF